MCVFDGGAGGKGRGSLVSSLRYHNIFYKVFFLNFNQTFGAEEGSGAFFLTGA